MKRGKCKTCAEPQGTTYYLANGETFTIKPMPPGYERASEAFKKFGNRGRIQMVLLWKWLRELGLETTPAIIMLKDLERVVRNNIAAENRKRKTYAKTKP